MAQLVKRLTQIMISGLLVGALCQAPCLVQSLLKSSTLFLSLR